MESGGRRRAPRWAVLKKAGPYPLLWLAVIPLALSAIVRVLGLDGETALAPVMTVTPWLAVAALMVLGVTVAVENWAASIVAGVSLAMLAAVVLPRAFGGREEAPKGAETLTVLSANVYVGQANAGALMDLVRRIRPDVLTLQETTPNFVRRLRRAGIERVLPESDLVVRAQDVPKGRPGIGVFADRPIRRLPRDVHSSVLPFELSLPGGKEVRMVDVHPLTPSFNQLDRWRGTLAGLPATGVGTPWVLVGDFNATLDQSALRDVLNRGYRDAADVSGDGLEMTWPNNRWFPPLVTIDHVLADERLGISGYGVEDLAGSDHRAIWAEVFLKSSDPGGGAR
jgi:endonuclease/exonuclease/phosphatase (EEP) superfamily protein YafD